MENTPARKPRDEIIIPLVRREDKNGNDYYLAWPDAPATINLNESMLFVFVANERPIISIRRKERLMSGEKPGQ